MESLLGIGQLARASGLTVSALRFYDQAGVLRPARVDDHTGYRLYRPDQVVLARLIARLRRAGMPLAGLREVVDHRDDPAVVEALLAGHLGRLEHSLSTARRELGTVLSLLTDQEARMFPTTVTVDGTDLAEALRAVRFAVAADPDLPVLGGVLFDLTDEHLMVAATDRYRLAVAAVSVTERQGPDREAVVPAAVVDALATLSEARVQLEVTDDTLTARADAVLTVEVGLLPDAFPAYRQLLPGRNSGPSGRPVTDELRRALAQPTDHTVRRETDGVTYEVVTLALDGDGQLTLAEPEDGISVNREFLLQALDAGGPGQLVLDLEGSTTPLVIHAARSLSLLMPVRPETACA